MRWTDGWFEGGAYRQGWEIAWDNGPTRVLTGPAIGEFVHGDLVRYERYPTLTAWAVSLVHHVRNGGQVPQLDDLRIEAAWREILQRTEFPERARTPEEQGLAGVLLRHGLRDYRQGLAATQRAWVEKRRTVPAPPLPEVLMGRARPTFGLDALVALEHAGNVVELSHHGLDRTDRLGLP